MNRLSRTLICTGALAAVLPAVAVVAQTPPAIVDGVAAGEVTSTSAVVWARSDRAATMRALAAPAAGAGATIELTASSSADGHLAAQAVFTGLSPATRYRYEIWFEADGARGASETGTFRTAPAADASGAVSLIWGGDLAGQGYCRQVGVGFPIFEPMRALDADFFVANGDMIYADSVCPARGPLPGWENVPGEFLSIADPAVDWNETDTVEEIYAAHWRYNRADPGFQAFLRSTPMYIQWDDHEVINDFGAAWPVLAAAPDRAGYPNIVAAGRKTFFDFHPFTRHPDEADRIYRAVRWGRDVELFILDARSYRSENRAADDPDAGKTMLGAAQLAWLKDALASSTATWKVVSSDVPLAIPTGSRPEALGRDAFAGGSSPPGAAGTGFERELFDLLEHLDAEAVANIVFIATDVHFAAQFRYEQDFDGDGEPLLFHELVSGPLSAVRRAALPELDPTLHPVVLYAEGDIFNFGTLRIEDGGTGVPRLSTDIRDETGRIRPGSVLELRPE